MGWIRTGKRTGSLAVLLALLLSMLLAACGGSDRPPDDGTPEPPVLKGVYSGEEGSLTFNGDGQSIILNISGELAAASGLPEGESRGTYVFLFRNEKWRYDKAETFRVTIGDKSWQFRNSLGQTDEKTVAAFMTDGGEAVAFRKEG